MNPRVASLTARTGCPRSRSVPRSAMVFPRRVHRHVRRCEVFHLLAAAAEVYYLSAVPRTEMPCRKRLGGGPCPQDCYGRY